MPKRALGNGICSTLVPMFSMPLSALLLLATPYLWNRFEEGGFDSYVPLPSHRRGDIKRKEERRKGGRKLDRWHKGDPRRGGKESRQRISRIGAKELCAATVCENSCRICVVSVKTGHHFSHFCMQPQSGRWRTRSRLRPEEPGKNAQGQIDEKMGGGDRASFSLSWTKKLLSRVLVFFGGTSCLVK